jgi:DMSO/TMAO reductase YedYZ molybdopterin-dependent catalytic subunit
MAQSASRLDVLSEEPYNAETVLAEHPGVITPTSAFYKRNHFPIPNLDPSTWTLTVDGEVEQPLVLSYDAILSLPRRTLTATLECAGNARVSFEPPAEGEPWKYGAVSTAEWTGTPLAGVLGAAGLRDEAWEITFEGADRGAVAGKDGSIVFERSLPVERALHPDTLLVYAMNGERLVREHGAPIRLIVPGWYGMASVKWLERVRASTEQFRGFFQWDRYMMVDPTDESRREPLGTMRMRSIFTEPVNGSTLSRGHHHIRGLAWSGSATVERVDISTDAGESWLPAYFTSRAQPYAWRHWEFGWDPDAAGSYNLQSRATDVHGDTQPVEANWNRLGYANNAIVSVDVTVV